MRKYIYIHIHIYIYIYIYTYIYIYIDKLQRSHEPTAHLSPQRGSLMDSQSKPRRNVIIESLEVTKDGQPSE